MPRKATDYLALNDIFPSINSFAKEPKLMTTCLIVGCGYVGRQVAKLEKVQGNHVTALTGSAKSKERLRNMGIDTAPGDLDDASSLAGLPTGKKIVYYFAPPPGRGIIDSRMQAFVAALGKNNLPARVVLISTTGVYGDCRGEWVREERPPAPETDRAKRRLSAENTLLDWSADSGVPVVILRVPGIYGPGRLPLKRLLEGTPVLREEDSPFSNRIHVDDLARACYAAARKGKAGVVYNVSDGHPTTMTDYFFKVADLLEIPRPPAIPIEEAKKRLSAGILSYLAESKKIDNRRMREELGVEPHYPDLESGLPACLE